MKKLLLLFLAAGSMLSAGAQGPTFNYESWTGTGANIAPTGWVSGNFLVNALLPGNTQSVFQATAPDVHGGTYAMKIVTVDVVTNPDATVIPDPIGFAAIGSVSMIPSMSLKMGFDYTARPASVEFYYKYAPTVPDSAMMFLWLTKWNGTTRDTIAIGYWQVTSAVSAYTQASVTLLYDGAFPNTMPDTCGVLFSATSGSCLTCGKVGSTLFVDDFLFIGWNGMNETSLNDEGVILYPNPASHTAYISTDADAAASVSLVDVTGRIVMTVAMDEPKNGINKRAATLPVANLANGIYSYVIQTQDGKALKGGKLNIVH